MRRQNRSIEFVSDPTFRVFDEWGGIRWLRTDSEAIRWRLLPIVRERGAENDPSIAFDAAKISVELACPSR